MTEQNQKLKETSTEIFQLDHADLTSESTAT